ncbi:unnamed protein product, partial [Mesorhabditis spiculigera]
MLSRSARQTISIGRQLSNGATRRVTLIPGEGIGPEISKAVQEIFELLSSPIVYALFFFGQLKCQSLGTPST